MPIQNLTINRGTTFGGLIAICKDASGAVVPLAGYSAFAEARKCPDSPVVINFAPIIEADDTEGKITIPPLTPAQTKELPAGAFPWDLILQDPDGIRAKDPLFVGTLSISKLITQPA